MHSILELASLGCLVRVRGIEPRFQAWEAHVIAVILHPRKASPWMATQNLKRCKRLSHGQTLTKSMETRAAGSFARKAEIMMNGKDPEE